MPPISFFLSQVFPSLEMASYHYSVSAKFPNGVRLDYLQSLIIGNPSIGVLCTSITVNGDDMSINFNAALSVSQQTALNKIIADYTNPAQQAIQYETDAIGSQAISLVATASDSGITLVSGSSGFSLTTSGPFVISGNQMNARNSLGIWKKQPRVMLPDSDYSIQVSDLCSGTMILNATAARTLYMPAAADLVAALSNPVVGDSIDSLVLNLGSFGFVIGAATGMTAYGSSIGNPNSSKMLRIVLTGVDAGSESYDLCFLT